MEEEEDVRGMGGFMVDTEEEAEFSEDSFQPQRHSSPKVSTSVLHVSVCSGFMFIFPFKARAAPQHKQQNRLEYEVRTTQMYLVSTDLASLFLY